MLQHLADVGKTHPGDIDMMVCNSKYKNTLFMGIVKLRLELGGAQICPSESDVRYNSCKW